VILAAAAAVQRITGDASGGWTEISYAFPG
jgi:hypothetical protein